MRHDRAKPEMVAEITETYDKILNSFLDTVFEINKDLIDDENFAK